MTSRTWVRVSSGDHSPSFGIRVSPPGGAAAMARRRTAREERMLSTMSRWAGVMRALLPAEYTPPSRAIRAGFHRAMLRGANLSGARAHRKERRPRIDLARRGGGMGTAGGLTVLEQYAVVILPILV